MGGLLLKNLKSGLIGALFFIGLVGCTSDTNETKALNKEVSKTAQGETVSEKVMFEQKQVKNLKLVA